MSHRKNERTSEREKEWFYTTERWIKCVDSNVIFITSKIPSQNIAFALQLNAHTQIFTMLGHWHGHAWGLTWTSCVHKYCDYVLGAICAWYRTLPANLYFTDNLIEIARYIYRMRISVKRLKSGLFVFPSINYL